jgi:hypothetical protein
MGQKEYCRVQNAKGKMQIERQKNDSIFMIFLKGRR